MQLLSHMYCEFHEDIGREKSAQNYVMATSNLRKLIVLIQLSQRAKSNNIQVMKVMKTVSNF